ncbi:M15 family metallopeptidase [Acetobacter sp. AN02]|uniref:M15 family metallopeptidase n=1 Tax=Acetobacter sp. AN02 TaxID=2894186 RepID=UPI0024340C6B|nr:M15 family metallopeptidase [Acetobacter sp. AN02]MDG6094389.1 M15 family metallopeptidase [Acetobacter sp. AN02]
MSILLSCVRGAFPGYGAGTRALSDGSGMMMTRYGLFSALLLLGMTASDAFADGPEAVFRITPVRPVAELLPGALAAVPPAEHGAFRASDLVELTTLDPTIRLDIRYATSRNFLGTPLYSQARAFLQRPAAEALERVQQGLRPLGYGLVIYDGYRPWYVTKLFWDATPPDRHEFVGNPAHGSRHNRGCAVDLGLYDLKTGATVPMPSGYDEMTPRAYADYAGGTEEERQARDLLRRAMEREGFTVYDQEWWHFDYRDWPHYAIGNVRFEDL